jgi:hypothetical protein
MGDDLWPIMDRGTDQENDDLIKPFLEEEINFALFQMEKNKVAGPDGMPIEFYQKCWAFIKKDICDMFDDFYLGSLNIQRINYGIVTLFPKIHQFRPICLLKCIYKLFTKCLTVRLESVASRILHKAQSTFIQGRNIMNSILALHEVLHETNRKKQVG